MKYAGRWHTKGNTESIIAAGVYYAYIDDRLEGGALKFRPKHAPQPWYEIPTDVEEKVDGDGLRGAIVVLLNLLKHGVYIKIKKSVKHYSILNLNKTILIKINNIFIH